MHSLAWWPSVGALALASIIDVHRRRIPNWLVVPFLLSGVVLQCITDGIAGAGRSLGGIGTAVLLFGVPCAVRAMGLGDLKLAAAVGAWIGAGQMVTAWVITAIVGGLMAVGYAMYHRSLGVCLDRTSDLLSSRVLEVKTANNTGSPKRDLSIPYAPAIAVGALISFFAR